MTLGDRLKETREKRKLNQADLADIVGVGRTTVSLWETDKKTPSGHNLNKIAAALDVTLDFLLNGVQARGSSNGNPRPGDSPSNRQEDLIIVPSYDYSALGTGVDIMETDSALLAAQKFAAYKRENLFLIKQDIPFRMVETGPVPATYDVVGNRGFSFKSGFVYLVSIRGSQKIFRVTKYADGTIDLQDDSGTKTLTVDDQTQVGYAIIAKIIAAIPNDMIDLE